MVKKSITPKEYIKRKPGIWFYCWGPKTIFPISKPWENIPIEIQQEYIDKANYMNKKRNIGGYSVEFAGFVKPTYDDFYSSFSEKG